MPVIENFAADPDYVAPQTSPAAAELVPEAIQRTAAQIGQTADDFAQSSLSLQRETQSSGVLLDQLPKLQDIANKWKLVPDRAQAEQGFLGDAKSVIAQATQGIDDPYVTARVQADLGHSAASLAGDVDMGAFQQQRNAAAAQLDAGSFNTARALAQAGDNQGVRSTLTQAYQRQLDSAVAAHLIEPADAEMMREKLASRSATEQAKADMNADPGATYKKLLDPGQYPDMDPGTRDGLVYRADRRAEMLINQQNAAVAHADAMADRNLKRLNTQNEATILSGIAQGQTPDPATLGTYLDHQLISVGGYETIASAIRRQKEGTDDPNAVVALQTQLGNRTLTADDVHQAVAGGHIRTETAATLMRGLDGQAKEQQSATERGYFGQLKTALQGQAVEQGLFQADRAPEVARWAQAQGEWTERVTANHEDPKAVLADMLPRYQDASTPAPTWLPAPRLGTIAGPQDLAPLAQRTKAALDSGQIDQATYQQQVDLWNRYNEFYQRQAASLAVKPPKPGAPAATAPAPAEGGQ